jgi:hypothetical protein
VKRHYRVIPLSLPLASEQSTMVSGRLAEFAKAVVGGGPVALLDVGGAGASHRDAIVAAVGAERCLYMNSSPEHLHQHSRWEITETDQLSRAIPLVIVLAPLESYLGALRTVHERFPGQPVVALPFAGTGGAPGAPPPIATVSLGDDAPVVFSLYPNCGANRLRPVVRALMNWYEKRWISTIAPNAHRRFLASTDAPPLAYGDFPPLRRALDDAYFRALDLIDLDCWTEVHDHVSTEMLARLGFCKVVALYRDPRDYIVSIYHWLCDPFFGDRFQALAALPKEEGLLSLFEGLASKTAAGDSVYQVPPLASAARDFVALRKHPNILAVSFEEARLDPRPLYRRMIAWLGLDDVVFKGIPDEGLDSAISLGTFSTQSGGAHKEGATDTYHRSATAGVTGLRKGIVGDWRNHFSPKVTERAKALIGEPLIELGYEKDLNW